METYEKRFKEVLAKAQEAITYLPDPALKTWLESVFPELKEDEDERTRKEIIEFLDNIWHLGKNANLEKWDKCDCSKWICWLEKQEKAGWSEKDIKMIDSIIEEVRPCGECPDYPTDDDREYYYEGQDRVDWLERLKNKRNRYDFMWVRKNEVLDKICELCKKPISQSDFVIKLENWLKYGKANN